MANTYNNELVKFEKFKIELADLMNKYGYDLVKFKKFKIELADLMNKYGYKFSEPCDPHTTRR